MIAEFLLSVALMGQCGLPVVVGPPEHHVLCNHGPVYSKFYVTAQFPSGHRTSIPVINNVVPAIQVKNGGGYLQLVMDYSQGRCYSAKDQTSGVLVYRYSKPEPKTCPVPMTQGVPPERSPTPASAPQSKPVPQTEKPEAPGYFEDRMNALEKKIDALIDESDKVKSAVSSDATRSASELQKMREMIDEMRKNSAAQQVPLPPPAEEPTKDSPPVESSLEQGGAKEPLKSSLENPLQEDANKTGLKSPLLEDWMKPNSPFTGTIPAALGNSACNYTKSISRGTKSMGWRLLST